MPVDRELPTEEAADLLALTRELADAELAPHAAAYEARGAVPAGGVPHARQGRPARPAVPGGVGGGGQPYEVYLQVLEELAARLGQRRARRQRAHAVLLPDRRTTAPTSSAATGCPTWLGGEPARAPTACRSRTPAPTPPRCATRAARDGRRLDRLAAPRPGSPTAGTPTSTRRSCAHPRDGARGISCFLLAGRTAGLSARPGPSEKMGLTGSTTAALRLDDVRDRRRPPDREPRARASRSRSAALDSGRLGIARRRRRAGAGRPRRRRRVRQGAHGRSAGAIIDFQGLALPARRHGRRRSSRPARPTSRRPAARTPAGPSAGRRAWPSCSPPTPR